MQVGGSGFDPRRLHQTGTQLRNPWRNLRIFSCLTPKLTPTRRESTTFGRNWCPLTRHPQPPGTACPDDQRNSNPPRVAFQPPHDASLGSYGDCYESREGRAPTWQGDRVAAGRPPAYCLRLQVAVGGRYYVPDFRGGSWRSSHRCWFGLAFSAAPVPTQGTPGCCGQGSRAAR